MPERFSRSSKEASRVEPTVAVVSHVSERKTGTVFSTESDFVPVFAVIDIFAAVRSFPDGTDGTVTGKVTVSEAPLSIRTFRTGFSMPNHSAERDTSNSASAPVRLKTTGERTVLSPERKMRGRFSETMTSFAVTTEACPTPMRLSDEVDTTASTTQVVRLSGKASVVTENFPFASVVKSALQNAVSLNVPRFFWVSPPFRSSPAPHLAPF